MRQPATDTIYSLADSLTEARQLGIRIQLESELSSVSMHEIGQLMESLTHHGVICLVNQRLEPKEVSQFASRWGEVIELPPGLANKNLEPDCPSITRVGNIRPDGTIIPDVHFAEYWHHDGDFWAPGQNYLVNFLSSVVVPSVGGRTGFLDTRLAYDSLTPNQKNKLAGASIRVRASEISDFRKATPEELPPDVNHPVVLPHPHSGQAALYLPDSSTGIEAQDGTPLGTAQSVIDPLIAELGIHEHDWDVGDLLITDNLQVMHRSMGGYGNNPRLLYRCQARIKVPSRASIS